MKKFILAFVFLSVLVNQSTFAQGQAVITANQFEAKADDAYERKEYNAALANYMSILNDDPDRSDIYWRTAECARLTRHFVTAEKYYEALSKKPELSSAQPLLDFRLASVKKNLEKYDAAIALFQKYTTSEGKFAAEAASEIKQIKWAQSKLQEKKTYEVNRLKESAKVNTIYIDAAPVMYGSKLYYTTGYIKSPEAAAMQEQQNVYTSNLVRKPKEFLVTNVFEANLKDQPKPLSFNSQTEGIHTAYYAPNTEGSRLYYAMGEQTDSGVFNFKLYVRPKSADGTWDKPMLLDTNTINIPGFTATQPNIGFDKTKGKDVLYFVSDRTKGGKGGLDIWAADIEADGRINAPVNLSINTEKDDISPFFMNGPQILLFSTDGDLNESFGGFDIFKTTLSSSGFEKAENMGTPMNSSYDDMYASFTAENARYYFVSNRPGGLCGSDKKDCVCNDIYDADIKVNLDVSTLLAETGKELNGCKVELIDIETGTVVYSDVNTNGNTYASSLDPNKTYRLIASKKGYQSDTLEFNTMGLYLPVTTITQKLKLKPNLKMMVYVFDRMDRKALEGSTVEIRSEDGKTLYATETLKGNMLSWDGLEFGKTYLISAFKETYEKDTKTDVIETWSSTMSKFVYRDSLYLTPFSGLPLTLYYDNDYPDPRSRKMITIYTYGETFSSYYSKQSEYLNSYYKDNRDMSTAGANEISDFFQNRLKFGYDKLNDFSTKLIKYLNNGYGMEIVLEGYASPLAETEYNRILTSRRVSAVINHFYKYNGGMFRQFIKNGQLRLKVEPYGEDRAQTGVSDDAKDRRKSVYSVAAMRERKVEIKEINVFQHNPKDGYSISDALGIYFDSDEFGKRPKKNVTLDDVDLANGKVKKGRKGTSSKASATPVELGPLYAKEVPVAKTVGKQQRREIVFVDSYTGEILKKEASVELFDQYTDKSVSKGKRKGKSYYYNVDLTKDYIVKGSASGYSEATVTKANNIYTEGYGSMLVDTMYLTPFGGLPLSLYFDNDKPAGGATETTSVTYESTYRPYMIRKQEFIGSYNKMMEENGGMIVAENSMNKFFEGEIRSGYDRLVGFSDIMKAYLQRGTQLEIIVEGYASPLANSEYNQRLSTRRVNSVINHFTSFGGGVLAKYIKSGQLKISVMPHGEINTNVSDNVKNLSSIYSIEASKERKVVIKDIVILNNNFFKN
jgi:outer membrane protein OmpA-like peptidoglycan-associated protein